MQAGLFATNKQAVNGTLYNGNTALRKLANNVYSSINERGADCEPCED
jgi:hypothetical protein